MDLHELFPFIPFVVNILIARLKVHLPEEKDPLIPDIAGLTGLGLVALMLYLTGPYSAVDWARLCAEGLGLGFGAVGLHQSIKQRMV